MSDVTLDTDAKLIAAVTREAGELAASFLGEKFDQWEKSPGNPVTEADLAVDDLIKRRLMGMRPNYGWLSEETADDPSRLDRSRVWVVDPIDGTRAFVKGRDGFCVSVALVENGVPVLAALDAPLRGLFFQARRGQGATLNGLPMTPSTRAALAGCAMLADAPMFGGGFWPEAWPEMAITKPNSIALRIALVACGQADAAVALQPKNEWDMAAAVLILEEAGGVWSDHYGQRPSFNRADPIFATVVAANPALYPEVARRVSEGVRAWEAVHGKALPGQNRGP